MLVMEGTSTSSAAAPQSPAAAEALATQPQVFINHTGPNQHEAAGRFAAQFANALQGAGIDAFIDFKSLHKGEQWRVRLMEAAANSRVFVAVVCKAYTRRFWPMLELDLALQRWDQLLQQAATATAQGGALPIILPVLYEDLREELEGIVQHWSDPQELTKLSDEERGQVDAERWAHNIQRLWKELQAYWVSNYHAAGKGGEVQLQTDIVARVREELPPPFVAPNAIGFDGHLQKVLDLLEGESAGTAGARGVWLHGVGETWVGGDKKASICMIYSLRMHVAASKLQCGAARLC
jgi:hypothetical protein